MNPTIDTAGAAATFADFRIGDRTLRALDQMGIRTPTPIQAEAVPALLDGRDVIGQARTGSGKTLAFGIPAIELVDPAIKAVQVLVLTPTRELATQVAEVFEQLAADRGITVGLLFGGRAAGPQRLMLRQGAQVIVGTPGRVLDMLNQGALWLDKVRYLVLDEADEMLDRGFAPDVERILGRATSARQTALFSATVPDWVRKTADRHLNDPVSIAVDPGPENIAPVPHTAYDVPNDDKMSVLKQLLDQQGDGSIIVFGRTKHGVKKLARQLQAAGYPVAALQGNLSQNARDEVMENFRNGKVRILLATNVAARGLDISHVEQVINMELPESPQLLTHRVGRTGRMGRQGQAITLLGKEDHGKWRQLERGLGRKIERKPWTGAAAALADDGQPEVAPRTRQDLSVVTEPIEPTASDAEHGRRRSPRPVRTERKASTWNGQALPFDPATAAADDSPVGTSAGRQRQRTAASTDRAPNRTARPEPNGNRREPEVVEVEVDGNRWDYDSRAERDRRRQSRNGIRPIAPVLYSNRSSVTRPDSAPDRARKADQPRERQTDAPRRERRQHTPAADTGARHDIQCAACGVTTSVPFEPDPNRPVYCRDCYRAMRPEQTSRGGKRRERNSEATGSQQVQLA